MKEYSIVEQYAIVALNAQDSQHDTAAKNAAVAGIAAAKAVQKLLFEDDNPDTAEFERKLREQLDTIEKMSRKTRKIVESEITNILKAGGILQEIPNLLGCDMNYYTANVTMREYKSDPSLYQSIIEGIRAVVQGQEEVSEKTVILFWLFRESGCIHDILSVEEQETAQSKLLSAVYIGIMSGHCIWRKAVLGEGL